MMRLEAIRFGVPPGPEGPVVGDLDLDFIRNKKSGREQLPVAYVLRNKDLSTICQLREHVVDRRTKHEAKSLSALLLRQTKVPVLRGSYKSPGRLMSGVRVLLANAAERDDRNIYVLGTDDRLFQELRDRAEARTPAAQTDGPRRDTVLDGSPRSGDGAPMLDLIERRPVPTELLESLLGNAREIELVRQLILRAAKNDEPVLILGETGSGKEIVARAIHQYGNKRHGPFVPVNCGAIPSALLESTLFGNVKGAFTGALDRNGLWLTAAGGTLLLDEIGDLSLEHQAKILRALEAKQVRPVGLDREISVDARVIGATNRDIVAMMQHGQFREDLYYRLRSFTICTPSLRDHLADIPLMADHFWKQIIGDRSGTLHSELTRELQAYRWPGNGRQLKALLQRLFGVFSKETPSLAELRAVLADEGWTCLSDHATPSNHEVNLHTVECLRHLRRTDDAVRACQVALRAIRVDKRTDPAAITAAQVGVRQCLEELETLCMHPLLFHTEGTFTVIYQLKGKLSYFQSLLANHAEQAPLYWKNELSKHVHLAAPALFQAAERLLKGARRRREP